MSTGASSVNEQYVFRRREFEELLSENQSRLSRPRPAHGAWHPPLPQQRHHRVKRTKTPGFFSFHDNLADRDPAVVDLYSRLKFEQFLPSSFRFNARGDQP